MFDLVTGAIMFAQINDPEVAITKVRPQRMEGGMGVPPFYWYTFIQILPKSTPNRSAWKAGWGCPRFTGTSSPKFVQIYLEGVVGVPPFYWNKFVLERWREGLL